MPRQIDLDYEVHHGLICLICLICLTYEQFHGTSSVYPSPRPHPRAPCFRSPPPPNTCPTIFTSGKKEANTKKLYLSGPTLHRSFLAHTNKWRMRTHACPPPRHPISSNMTCPPGETKEEVNQETPKCYTNSRGSSSSWVALPTPVEDSPPPDPQKIRHKK